MYLSSTVVPVGQTYQKITCFFGPLQRVIFGAKNGIPTAVFDTPEKVGKHDDWPEGGTLPKSPPSPLPIRNTSIAIWAWGYLFLIWRIMFWVKKTCGFRSGCVRKDGSGCVRNLQLEKKQILQQLRQKKKLPNLQSQEADVFDSNNASVAQCNTPPSCHYSNMRHCSRSPLGSYRGGAPSNDMARGIRQIWTNSSSWKRWKHSHFPSCLSHTCFFWCPFRGIRGLCLVSDMQLSCAG